MPDHANQGEIVEREPLVSVGMVAEAVQVTPATIRNWIAKGYITAVTLPSGVRRIPESELQRLITKMFDVATGPEPQVAGNLRLGAVADDTGEPAV